VAAPVAKASAPAAPRAAEAAKDTTVRVETDTLDRIMNMVGELVLIRNRLLNLQSTVGNEAVTQTVANLDVVTSDLQMAAMKTRMQPIKKVFGRFPRVVRDLARSLDKEIELVMQGEDTDLDKNLVEALADPLVHLVRNAVDHGIEMPADRVARGKPACGTLRLAAAQGGDQIILTIADDGKGIDAEALRRKVVEKGLMEEEAAARLSTRECYELIFLPGFSTKDEISDISGRGVGMDVVKTRITQVNGSIEIDSQLGVGTTIRISVPLTLAIMPTLMVVLGEQVFALPLVNVQEIINFERNQAREVDGRKTMVVRGKALPLFYLSRWLVQGVYEFSRPTGHVVVVRIGNQSVGLLVDDLIGQEEVVIKPLGALLHGTKGLSGATITGNGKIALILDLPGLLEAYARR
ncbi:MAG: chemotaxis protein CheA, partial [Gammaproteobacteria bacterium]|nr:chemotaxis protein CheA [Gammaproteobacteria bacterium]